jgi:hypothetical protein
MFTLGPVFHTLSPRKLTPSGQMRLMYVIKFQFFPIILGLPYNIFHTTIKLAMASWSYVIL